MSYYKWILDAGHGGMKDGKYTTAPAKMFKFDDGLTIYEGVTNRAITKKLQTLLTASAIDFETVYDDKLDIPLAIRVTMADSFFKRDRRCIYLSIHSNAGGGRGLEIYTSKGQTKSDKIADIFCTVYQKHFPDFHFRSDSADGDADKEEDFYVLRKTDCPALLVENLFFDNRLEADYLLSEAGQEALALAMFDAIKMCETLKPI